MIRNERLVSDKRPAKVAVSSAVTVPTLFVGSFPSRECGIATFTKDIVDSYDAHGRSRSHVVAIDDRSDFGYVHDSRVIGRIKANERPSYYEAASLANRHRCGVVNIQHEYGLFGGQNGEWCLDFISALKKPVVLTLHTVVPAPNSDPVIIRREKQHEEAVDKM